MWRWTMTLLLVATLGLASTGCPQREPVIPPPDDPPPAEPMPPDHEHDPTEPTAPPEDPGSP